MEKLAFLDEYNRMTGVGPSLMEKAAADPMLTALSKAFSAKVKPTDLKFIQYRKVGHGVELEDKASRLGGILTSIEAKEADPKALMAYLKKHGAKTFKAEAVEIAEKTKRDWYRDGQMWRKEGTRFTAYVRDKGNHVEWNVSTATGSHYSVSGHAANTKAGMKAAENGARKLVQEIKDERAHAKRTKSASRKPRPQKGAAWESAESLDERFDSTPVAKTIMQQMGGPGRIQAMLGVKQFITYKDGVSFKFPNRKSSKGNYVKIILRPDDTYDMVFSKIVKYDRKPVKKYTGIHADQLIRLFEKQTGLYLHL